MPKPDKNEIVEEEVVISKPVEKPVTNCICSEVIGRHPKCKLHGNHN